MVKISNDNIFEFNTCVALGFFDGVHIGHSELIRQCVFNCDSDTLPSVFTFDENPLYYINNNSPKIILSKELKEDLIESLGVKCIFSPNFLDVMNMSAEEFIKNILKEKLKAKKVFCGSNFYFGKGGKASSEDLKAICKKYSIETHIIPDVKHQGRIVSSSLIRNCISTGKISLANELLGHNYTIDFEVQHGNQLGKKIGIPTINQYYPERFLIPKYGVYSSITYINQSKMYSVTNIGTKPTFNCNEPSVETWVPDYKGQDVYGERIKISLIEYLRPEFKFGSLINLKEQIIKDSEKSKEIVANI